MDRDKVLRICTQVYTGTTNITDAISIITEYCIENGKSPQDVTKLTSILLNIPPYIHRYLEVALEYYEKKFAICKLIKEDKILLIF